MAKVPKAPGTRTDIEPINSGDKRLKADVIRDAGFTQKQVERFQQMAAHPENEEKPYNTRGGTHGTGGTDGTLVPDMTI